MTSIIEQADAIVGIDWRKLGISPCHDTKDTYRRGAYVGWLSELKPDVNNRGLDLPRGIEDMAKMVVELHAASKPKGDGLPEDWQVRVIGTGAFSVRISPSNDAVGFERSTADAVAKHLALCLTPPVRRLLAAFDVVDGPYSPGVWFVVTKDGRIHTVNDIAYGAYVLTDVVCSLVPKVAK